MLQIKKNGFRNERALSKLLVLALFWSFLASSDTFQHMAGFQCFLFNRFIATLICTISLKIVFVETSSDHLIPISFCSSSFYYILWCPLKHLGQSIVYHSYFLHFLQHYCFCTYRILSFLIRFNLAIRVALLIISILAVNILLWSFPVFFYFL